RRCSRSCTRSTRRPCSTATTGRSGRRCWARSAPGVNFLHRHRWVTPYLLLAPGLAFLALFFVVPLGFLGHQSLETGDVFGLGSEGRLLQTSLAVVAGIIYNFLPFMALPLYVSLELIDQRLIEAAQDLYASKAKAFLRVTLPLSLPGVFAGTLLTFIPAAGDFVNAQLLGTPRQFMIGNVIQSRFLELTDYPTAAALSFILMAIILVLVAAYARALGTDRLT